MFGKRNPQGKRSTATGPVADAIRDLEKALITAVKTGGHGLGIKDIQRVVRDFQGQPKARAQVGAAPSPGFTQILIAPFCQVIVDDAEISREAVPRAIVPGYEAAMDMLCGEETVFKCRGRCQSLASHIETQKFTPAGLYDKVMGDTSGFKVLAYLLSKVVMRFEDFDERREWMIRFVNEKLAEEDEHNLPRLSRRDEPWKFGEDSFNKLFRAIVVDPKTDTQNLLMEKVYEIVWNSHDAKGVKVATQFMRALGADHSHKTSD